MISQRAIGAIVLVALVMGGSYMLVARNSTPQVSTHAAEVRSAEFWGTSLPDLARQEQRLDQWLGKVAVVNFWAPWCPPCRDEIPGFIHLQESLGGQGLQIVGVALDDEDKVRAYADETGINYPILLGGLKAVDLGKAAGNRLGGLPYTVVFDRKGNAIATLVGGVTQDRLEALVSPLL